MPAPRTTIGSTTRFRVTFVKSDGSPQPIGGFTTLLLRFDPPGAAVAAFDRALALETDGSDGVAYYDALATDLTVAGDWLAQGVYTGGGVVLNALPVAFVVERNL